MRIFRWLTALALFTVLAPWPVGAAPAWVRFQSATGEVRALIALPRGPGPHPAVIYNHGAIVRRAGYKEAAAEGYDTAGYVQALADSGYIGLAPIRENLASANRLAAITGGVEIVRAALDYLRRRDDVDASRVGAIGFSEGGHVTLRSAVKVAGFKAVVLMSPAAFGGSTGEPFLKRLTMPVMLTLGADDLPFVRKMAAEKMIPTMRRLGKTFVAKTDYPGDHRWFWKVRAKHFADVTAFLDKYLK